MTDGLSASDVDREFPWLGRRDRSRVKWSIGTISEALANAETVKAQATDKTIEMLQNAMAIMAAAMKLQRERALDPPWMKDAPRAESVFEREVQYARGEQLLQESRSLAAEWAVETLEDSLVRLRETISEIRAGADFNRPKRWWRA